MISQPEGSPNMSSVARPHPETPRGPFGGSYPHHNHRHLLQWALIADSGSQAETGGCLGQPEHPPCSTGLSTGRAGDHVQARGGHWEDEGLGLVFVREGDRAQQREGLARGHTAGKAGRVGLALPAGAELFPAHPPALVPCARSPRARPLLAPSPPARSCAGEEALLADSRAVCVFLQKVV